MQEDFLGIVVVWMVLMQAHNGGMCAFWRVASQGDLGESLALEEARVFSLSDIRIVAHVGGEDALFAECLDNFGFGFVKEHVVVALYLGKAFHAPITPGPLFRKTWDLEDLVDSTPW